MFGIVGKLVEKVADAVGAPEWFGDVAGIAASYFTGDIAGIVDGAIDLAENVGIDVKSIVPAPLYRAGMTYLSGGMPNGLAGLTEQFGDVLKNPDLKNWAGDEGFDFVKQLLAEKGLVA